MWSLQYEYYPAKVLLALHPAAPLTCDAIRIHITPKEDTAVGIIEVRVEFEEEK